MFMFFDRKKIPMSVREYDYDVDFYSGFGAPVFIDAPGDFHITSDLFIHACSDRSTCRSKEHGHFDNYYKAKQALDPLRKEYKESKGTRRIVVKSF